MKRKNNALINSLILVILLASMLVPQGAQAAPNSDAYEPDDTVGTASWIYHGDIQDHDISPVGDLDWVTFELTSYSTIDLDVASSEVGQMYLYLYDSTGTLLIDANDGSDGDGWPRITHTCAEDPLAPGVYSARLDASGGIEIAAYQLSFTTFTCQDLYEQDNDFSTASMILNGVPQPDHSIFPVSDADYVTFTLDEQSEIILTTSGSTPADTELFLYDAGYTLVEYDNDSNADGFSRIDRFCDVDSLEAGTYYARVNEYNNDEIIYNYQIDLTVTACDDHLDDYEEDNDYTTASTIFSGIPQPEHSIVPSYDEDWVTFTLDVPSAITLATSGPEPADTFLGLYDGLLAYIAYNDDNGIDAFSTIQVTCDTGPLEAGTYYALVRENYGDAEIYNYQIDLTITPCDVGPSGDDYEDDDTFDMASTLTSGEPQDHNIIPLGDVDWVSFTLLSPSAVVLETDGPAPTLDDTFLTLFDGGLTYISSNDDKGAGNQYSMLAYDCLAPLAAGTYYARAYEDGDDATIPAYQLILTATACDPGPVEDAFEDDDAWTHAKAITSGDPQEHNILPIGDQDWVTFELTGPSAVTLQTSGDTGYDTRLYLYDDPETGYIAYNDDSGGTGYSLVHITCLASGRYYAMVDDYNADGVIPAYQLELTVAACSPGGDAYELDNTYKTASRLLFGIPQANHSILPVGDTDWVKFVLAKEAGIRLTISGPQTGDVYMFLYDNPSAPALVYSDDSLIERTCGVNPFEAGTYYALIGDFMNDGTISSYQVDLAVTHCDGSTGDAYEDDDTYPQASTITSGVPQVGHSIDPNHDVDWVTFTLSEASAITLATSGPLPADTYLTLWDGTFTQIADNDDNGTDNFSTIRITCGSGPLQAGTYYARAEEYGNDEVIDSYQIDLTTSPCPYSLDHHSYLPMAIIPGGTASPGQSPAAAGNPIEGALPAARSLSASSKRI